MLFFSILFSLRELYERERERERDRL